MDEGDHADHADEDDHADHADEDDHADHADEDDHADEGDTWRRGRPVGIKDKHAAIGGYADECDMATGGDVDEGKGVK